MKQSVHLSACVCLILSVYAIGRAQKPELAVQTGHSSTVTSVAFSPDGRTLASGSNDHTVKLWDVATGTELRTLRGHSFNVVSVAFSPDGKTLASGSNEDKTIKLWDVASGAEIRSIKGHFYSARSLAFSPDGQTLASGGFDHTVKLWDVSTGTERHTLKGHSSWVTSIAFSLDGKIVATGGNDHTVNLWDAETGRLLHTLKGHSDYIRSVVFGLDGRTLASAGDDKTVRMWDVATGAESRGIELTDSKHTYPIAFSRDGKTLVRGSASDYVLKLLDVSTGKELQTLKGSSWGGVWSAAFSPDGRTLATGSNDNTIKLWDVAAGAELHTLKGGGSLFIKSVAFSPDGKTLAAGGLGDSVKLWGVAADANLRNFKEQFYQDNSVESIAFSPDGNTLVASGQGPVLKMWNTSTGTERVLVKGAANYFPSIAFSADGKRLASGSYDSTITLWDVSTDAELRTLKGHSGPVFSVAFSPAGRTLATGSSDGTVKLWDVETGAELRAFKGHSASVRSVAFSPDGKTLASGSEDDTIKLWNAATGRVLRTLKGDSTFTSIAFSPDGKRLASSSGNYTVKLWDVAAGTQLHTLKGHTWFVSSVAFSPNGKYLVSGSADSNVRIWEVSSGKELASLISIAENDWVVVTPDGLFDGSPSAWNQILWRFNNNTFDYAPVEAFFSDFYHPGLLADIFAGKSPKAPSDIAKKDRRQPEVKLSLANDARSGGAVDAPYVELRVDVAESSSDKDRTAGSGARDVRLFRNGTLVKLWRGDVLKGRRSATFEERIPVVAGENRFTAYAFNRDNVKSADAALAVVGAESLKRPATAYVLAVGINRYANASFNLNFAVADAEEFAGEWQRQQARVGRFAETVVVPLLDTEATKANIMLAIKRLVEVETPPLPAGVPKQLGKLKYANPEDGVVIYFAGHGTAHGNRFYLIPHDLGYEGRVNSIAADGLATLLARSISDRELEEAFERLNAGQLLMVLDACNSGQALEAEEKRRGPMNSKGLAQLAYEKGMYILTAAQSFQAAQEASQLGHGLLTFALVEEGLKQARADREPKDGTVFMREWLNYATERVPEMQIREMKRALARGMNLSFREEERGLNINQRSGQRPRVFYRRELEAQPVVIARPASEPPKK